MELKKLALISALCVFTFAQAEARPRHRQHHTVAPECHFLMPCEGISFITKHAQRAYHAIASLGPKPHAWCGWYMRSRKGVSDPKYNLARNWAHYGSNAGGPGVGVIVVWPHHVGEIVGKSDNGQWIVHSGNDGRRVRERPRSLAGVIAFRI